MSKISISCLSVLATVASLFSFTNFKAEALPQNSSAIVCCWYQSRNEIAPYAPEDAINWELKMLQKHLYYDK